MWSSFKKILHRWLGGQEHHDHSSLLPKDIDKLKAEFSTEEELEATGGPITAREAFELAAEILEEFDADARLRSIDSLGAVDSLGRAEGWQFAFLLPERWGYATFRFQCTPGSERLGLRLTPFVAAGSALDKMLDEGQDGFVEQQWKVEMERQPPMTNQFRDSSEVIQGWQSKGEKIDFSQSLVLRAVIPPLGKPRWELRESPNSKKSLCTAVIE